MIWLILGSARAAVGLMVVRMRAVTESGRQIGGWTWHRLSAEA